MSSLLTLGQDLEQKSKEQLERTSAMLKAAFSEHEASVKQELSESAKRINSAILDHEKGMTEAMQSNRLNVLRMVGRTWLIITMVSVLLIATSGSILWWQGQQMISNHVTLLEQQSALSKLNARTWGVTYQEDSQGRFLVLPAGMKADTNWTFDEGKKNGIRLVQE